MIANLYSSASSASGGLRTRLAALAAALLLAPAAWAQVVVPAGNPTGTGSTTARKPLATYFGYERSAMIYTAAEIGTSGSITSVGFYLNTASTPGAAPTKIYMKTVSNATFAAATTVAAEETGATLVYDSTIPATAFTANTWVTVPLTAPFAYNGTSNLEVIVETNATGGGNEGSTAKAFRYANAASGSAQFWQADTNPPTTTGTLSAFRPNIQLTGLTASSCPPITALTVGSITATGAQLTFTGGTGNTSYTVTYTSASGTSTTVTPAPTASPVTLSGLTSGTAYTVSVVGNCTGSTTSQAVTAGFTTLNSAPANDDCANAVTITPGATCTPTSGTVVGATQSSAPILCNGFTAAAAQDVWYKFMATATSHNIAVTGNFDGVLEVLSGASCSALTNVGCSDVTGNNESLTLTTLSVGTMYYVRYYPYVSNPTNGTFTLCITPPPTPLANDDPATATTLTINATCTPTNGTNTGATTTTANGYANPGVAPYTCGIAVSPKDVWYKFTTAATGAGSTAVTVQVTGAPAGYIRLFSAATAAGPFTELGCASGGANNTVSTPLTLNTLTPNTTYYVSVAGYGSADTQGAFTICVVPATPLAANDAAVQVIYSVGKAPVSAPQVVQAVVRNAGSAALPSFPLALNVTGATTFTDAKIVPALAVGATATVTFAAYTPATAGTNTLTVTAPADGQASNNTLTYTQAVTANSLSYIDDTQALNATGVGVSNTTPGGTLAAKYSINSSSVIGDVKLTFTANATSTSTYQVVIFNATGANGTPGTALFTSPTQTRPTAAGTVTVPVTGNITVNGPFYVGLTEVSGNVGIAYQVEDPLRPSTFYYRISATGAWTDVNTTTLKTRLAIEVGFSSRTLSTNSAALSKAISMFPNPSNGQVTLDIQSAQAKGSMQVDVINTLVQVVHTATVRDNAQNKLDLSGLSSGMYTVRVKSGAEYTIRQLALTK